ncbi:MAG: hypothetical protein HYZ42_09890 [Bacteroidetes bacterium]|nr:hypothetical protein [Bacteroidota bacterium]
MSCYGLKGQTTIPKFDSNFSKSDSLEYMALLKFSKKFDLTISLTMTYYYYRSSNYYYLLCLKDGKWSQIIVLKNNIRTKRLKDQTCTTNQDSCAKLFYLLKENHLFGQFDSLNINTKEDSGRIYLNATTHGINFTFLLLSAKDSRIIEAYNPDELYDFLPEIIQRNYFITCRNLMLKSFPLDKD